MAQIKPSVLNSLLGIDDSYKAPEKMWEILYDKEKRESLMLDFLKATDMQVDDDTFREYFEIEHADRKNKKQDFTPNSIAKLTSKLIGNRQDGVFYEGCAGTGSMTIAAWDEDRMQHSPFDYRPSWYFYHVEELSDRAIPFLIFNLAMRGMNATVVHCDVLTREAKGAFFIQNDDDDHMKFSSINLLPYTKATERELGVKFTEKKYKDIKESNRKKLKHLIDPVERGHVSDFTKLVYAMCGVDIISTNDKENAIEIDYKEDK